MRGSTLHTMGTVCLAVPLGILLSMLVVGPLGLKLSLESAVRHRREYPASRTRADEEPRELEYKEPRRELL